MALATQTVVLWVLRVPLGLQAAVLATATLAVLCGAALLRPVLAMVDDGPARSALAFLGGMVAITAASYVLFHEPVREALGLHSAAAGVRLALAVVVLGSLLAWRGKGLGARRGPPDRSWHGVLALVLALGMSAATIFGVANSVHIGGHQVRKILAELPPDHPLVGSTLPDWGVAGDYLVHLIKLTAAIEPGGLPDKPEEIAHRGLQVWVLSTSLAFDEFDTSDPMQAAKVLAVPTWFSLLALGWFVARRVLGVGSRASIAAMGAVALFGVINVPLFQVSDSSYAGFFNAATTLFHNAPQLYCVTLGMAALALIGLAVQGDLLVGGPFLTGAGFATASFWYKPAAFFVLGPAIGLAALPWLRRAPRIVLGVGAILAAPVAVWFVYPKIVDGHHYSLVPVLDPFSFVQAAALQFPSWVASSGWLLAGAVVTASWAAWAAPLASWAARTWRLCQERGCRAGRALRASPAQTVVIAALLIGFVVAALLTEEGRPTPGNMRWPSAAAYVLALPLLIRLVTDIRSRIGRMIAWVVVGLHIWSGGLHLYLIVSLRHL